MKRREGGKRGAGGDAGRSPRTPDPAVTPGRGRGRPCGFVRAEASVSPAASSRTRGHDAAAEPEEDRRPRGGGRPPGVQRGRAAGARGGLAELRGGGARAGPHSPAGGRRVPPPPAARDGSRCPAGHPPEPPLGVAEAPRGTRLPGYLRLRLRPGSSDVLRRRWAFGSRRCHSHAARCPRDRPPRGVRVRPPVQSLGRCQAPNPPLRFYVTGTD